MPKEVTHWSISDEIISRIDDTKIHKLLTDYRELFLLGSIFHDMLYYYIDDDNNIKQLSNKMHGANKEDTYTLVRVLDKKYSLSNDGRIKNLIYVFRLGIISHLCVDITFHPFVYYFTGNYYDTNKARQSISAAKHREIEALIDKLFVADASYSKIYNINNLLKKSRSQLESIFEDGLDISNYNIKIDQKTILRSYKNFALARSIYTNRWAVFLLKTFKNFLSGNLKSILELSYYNNNYFELKELKNNFVYHHPVTNEISNTDLQTLRDNAIKKFLALILQNNFTSKGESLATGLIASDVSDMKYFKKSV